MALADRVTERIPAQVLTALTAAAPGTTSADTDVLGYACDDVEADLRTWAGITYDETDARHVAAAVAGVVLRLALMKGQAEGAAQRYEDWQKALKDGLRLVTHNDRILATTRSPLRPVKETATEPLFNAAWFENLIPNFNRDGDSWPYETPS